MTEMIRVITGDGLLPSDHSFALSIQRGVVTHAIPIERLSRLLQCVEDVNSTYLQRKGSSLC